MIGPGRTTDAVRPARLVSALVAFAAAAGQTVPAPPAVRRLAAVEGWIHLPATDLGGLGDTLPTWRDAPPGPAIRRPPTGRLRPGRD